MEEILLTIIAVLGAIVTYFAWRVADQMPDIAFRLSEIQRDMATVARKASEPAPAPVVQAAPPPEPVQAETAAAPAPSQPMPARARGRGRAVMLPNGQKRIDYIRDRYYKEGVSRSDIRKEINQIMADANIDDKIQYQIVFAATKDPSDPRDNPAPRQRAAAAEAGTEAEGAAPDAAPTADADTAPAPESGDTRGNF